MSWARATGFQIRGPAERVIVEFVSANPTGPLHVGHGRQAAYGATLSNLLAAAGFSVHREYYINDAGRQMDILAVSVWLRYLEPCGEEIVFPSNGYRGEYLLPVAQALRDQVGTSLQAFRRRGIRGHRPGCERRRR
jgi:arginyl-tRNA synthetase